MIKLCCSLRRIYDTETFVIFFSKSSKQVHKVIISKDLIWSSYSIHFVSLHHYKVPSSSSSHYNAAVNLKASTSPPFSSSNPQAFDHHPRQRGGGEEGGDWTLPDWRWGIWTRTVSRLSTTMQLLYIIEYGGVQGTLSALSLTNGSE